MKWNEGFNFLSPYQKRKATTQPLEMFHLMSLRFFKK